LAIRSVVAIRSIGLKGETTATGTGFAVSAETIATDYHVIKNAQVILVSPVTESVEYRATVSRVDKENDLVLLKVPKAPYWKSLTIARTTSQTGDPIYAVTNPRGLEGTFSSGNVSGFRRLREGRDLIQITAPVSPGSSGGPVLNQKGEVVGVVVSGLSDAQNINFAIPAPVLRRLIIADGLESGTVLTPKGGDNTDRKTRPQIGRLPEGVTFVDEDEITSLRGLPGLHVVIENEKLSPELASLGLEESRMQSDAELILSAAGIKILRIPGSSYLYINPTILLQDDGTYSYSLSIEIRQLVALPRSKAQVFATTWSRGLVGYCSRDRLGAIREDIATEINKFVADYRLANQKH
jgi:hypothetical protein